MKLRNKFFLVLVGIPALAVFALLFVTTQVFLDDKKLFIYESQLQNAHVIANQIMFNLTNRSVDKNRLQSLDVFYDNNYSKLFLIDQSGQIVATSLSQYKSQPITNYFSASTIAKLADLTINEGSFEDIGRNSVSAFFSFVRMPQEKMTLLIQTPKSSVVRASAVFILKGIVTLIGLILSSAFASLILSKSMTKDLNLLESSMKNFGQGKMDIQVKMDGQDEISKLGRYFNQMVIQIANLIKEQKEKVKLELEMDMAGKLQEGFFPNKTLVHQCVEFSGFYQPSDKCSGDWWYYFIQEDNFVAFIGDVTGHGVKSALMTSASRSMLAYIEDNFVDTAKAMTDLSKGFFAAANGEVNMSALMIRLNLGTGELEYTNASHDPAIIYDPNTNKVELIEEVHGKRLGTSKVEIYKKSMVNLRPGQIIFSYTDGLLEVTNKNNRTFNDRQILKSFREINFSADNPLTFTQDEFQNYVLQFSGGLDHLKDDLSYFFVKFKNFHSNGNQSLHRREDSNEKNTYAS